MKYLVYKATLNNKIYVGITKDLTKRKKGHKFNSSEKCKSNNKWSNAIRKHGFKNITWEILLESDDWGYIQIQEILAIKHFDSYCNGYNSTKGGDGAIGIIPSSETKAKISKASLLNWKNHEYRKLVSESISKGRLGIEPWNKNKTHEYGLKGSNNPMFGKNIKDHMTKEAYAKWKLDICKSHGNKEFSVWNAICIKPSSYKGSGIFEKGNFIGIFLNKSKFSKNFGVSRSGIRDCLNKKAPQAKGYIFEYTKTSIK